MTSGGDRFRPTLIEYAASWRDMLPHIGTLERLASESPKIIELGVRGGVSTWAFLDGLPTDGQLWSVDIDEPRVPNVVHSDPRWSFIQGDDQSVDIWYRLPPRADIVFIDTSHEYEHTRLELLLALTRQPSRIICHDAKWPGVEQAIADFCDTHSWRISQLDVAGDAQGDFSLAVLEPS